jgi:hypothetical protein
MVAGLPGTGVGGVFYLLLAVAMPIVELFRTIRGKSDLRRWGFVALQLTLVVWIIVGISAEVWCLNWLLVRAHAVAASMYGVQAASVKHLHKYLTAPAVTCGSALASLITLTAIFAAVRLLRLRCAGKKNAAVMAGARR